MGKFKLVQILHLNCGRSTGRIRQLLPDSLERGNYFWSQTNNCNTGLIAVLRDKMFIRISPDIWPHGVINQHFASSLPQWMAAVVSSSQLWHLKISFEKYPRMQNVFPFSLFISGDETAPDLRSLCIYVESYFLTADLIFSVMKRDGVGCLN